MLPKAVAPAVRPILDSLIVGLTFRAAAKELEALETRTGSLGVISPSRISSIIAEARARPRISPVLPVQMRPAYEDLMERLSRALKMPKAQRRLGTLGRNLINRMTPEEYGNSEVLGIIATRIGAEYSSLLTLRLSGQDALRALIKLSLPEAAVLATRFSQKVCTSALKSRQPLKVARELSLRYQRDLTWLKGELRKEDGNIALSIATRSFTRAQRAEDPYFWPRKFLENFRNDRRYVTERLKDGEPSIGAKVAHSSFYSQHSRQRPYGSAERLVDQYLEVSDCLRRLVSPGESGVVSVIAGNAFRTREADTRQKRAEQFLGRYRADRAWVESRLGAESRRVANAIAKESCISARSPAAPQGNTPKLLRRFLEDEARLTELLGDPHAARSLAWTTYTNPKRSAADPLLVFADRYHRALNLLDEFAESGPVVQRKTVATWAARAGRGVSPEDYVTAAVEHFRGMRDEVSKMTEARGLRSAAINHIAWKLLRRTKGEGSQAIAATLLARYRTLYARVEAELLPGEGRACCALIANRLLTNKGADSEIRDLISLLLGRARDARTYLELHAPGSAAALTGTIALWGLSEEISQRAGRFAVRWNAKIQFVEELLQGEGKIPPNLIVRWSSRISGAPGDPFAAERRLVQQFRTDHLFYVERGLSAAQATQLAQHSFYRRRTEDAPHGPAQRILGIWNSLKELRSKEPRKYPRHLIDRLLVSAQPLEAAKLVGARFEAVKEGLIRAGVSAACSAELASRAQKLASHISAEEAASLVLEKVRRNMTDLQGEFPELEAGLLWDPAALAVGFSSVGLEARFGGARRTLGVKRESQAAEGRRREQRLIEKGRAQAKESARIRRREDLKKLSAERRATSAQLKGELLEEFSRRVPKACRSLISRAMSTKAPRETAELLHQRYEAVLEIVRRKLLSHEPRIAGAVAYASIQLSRQVSAKEAAKRLLGAHRHAMQVAERDLGPGLVGLAGSVACKATKSRTASSIELERRVGILISSLRSEIVLLSEKFRHLGPKFARAAAADLMSVSTNNEIRELRRQELAHRFERDLSFLTAQLRGDDLRLAEGFALGCLRSAHPADDPHRVAKQHLSSFLLVRERYQGRYPYLAQTIAWLSKGTPRPLVQAERVLGPLLARMRLVCARSFFSSELLYQEFIPQRRESSPSLNAQDRFDAALAERLMSQLPAQFRDALADYLNDSTLGGYVEPEGLAAEAVKLLRSQLEGGRD